MHRNTFRKLSSAAMTLLIACSLIVPSTVSAEETSPSVQLKEPKARVSVHDPSSLKMVTRITCSVPILRLPSQPI